MTNSEILNRSDLVISRIRLPNSSVEPAPKLVDLIADLRKVAESDATVCIYGESGTGKELLARAIHHLSRRNEAPLIIFDPTAVPEGLIESEMFGHVKGSFTGAVGERQGVFELAQGGALFLDEVGELPLSFQAKFLRVIQSKEFRKVGGSKPIRVDVRMITATNRDLARMVAKKTFREDLYYRIHVVPIIVPPLRERKADIPLLVGYFLDRFRRNGKGQIKGISEPALSLLLRHDWPGNIRELENCIERAVVMAKGDIIETENLSMVPRKRDAAGSDTKHAVPIAQTSGYLDNLERERILHVLQSTRGNKSQAATVLGIHRATLYRKFERYTEEETAMIKSATGPTVPAAQATTRLADLEREHIFAVLRSLGGDKRKAVELLGISLRGLYFKLKKYKRDGLLIPAFPRKKKRG